MVKKNQFLFDGINYQGYQTVQKAYAGMTEGVASQGGETVPTPLADFIIDEIEKLQWARKLFRQIPMPGKTFEIPTITAGDTIYLASEGSDFLTEGGSDGSSSSYTRPVFGSITLTAQKFAGLTGYTTELDQDSAVSIATVALRKLIRAFAEGEEQSFIQANKSAEIFSPATGSILNAWDGIISHVPGTAAAVNSVWTPQDSSVPNWIAGGSAKLVSDKADELIAQIEDNRGQCDVFLVSPKVAARFRNKVEFEALQGIKDVGREAALVKGFVGKYYTASLFTSHWLPTGDSNFVTQTADPKDTILLGLDKSSPFIADRRRISILQRHRFYSDVNEIRVTERLSFHRDYGQLLGGIHNVQNSV